MTVNPVPQGLPTNGRSSIDSVQVHEYSVSDVAAMCRRLSVFRADIGRVAQLVEQVTFNHWAKQAFSILYFISRGEVTISSLNSLVE